MIGVIGVISMIGMCLGERAVHLALRCYPRWWRDRYGPDQEALIEDLKAERSPRGWLAADNWGLAASFVLGAVRARVSGCGMPGVPELWQRRASTAILVGNVPAALAVPVALLLLGHTSEYGRSGAHASAHATSAIQLATVGQVAHWEVTVLWLLWLAFVVQLIVGAVGLARTVGSLAAPGRRILVAAATLAPVVAVGLGLLLLQEASSLRPVIGSSESIGHRVVHVWYSYSGHPLAAAAFFWAGWIGMVGGWVGGILVPATKAGRLRFPFSLEALTIGIRHARALTLLQACIALGEVALAATLLLQPPIGPNGGLIYRSGLGLWTPVVCAALLAAAAITWAATRVAGQAVSRLTPPTSDGLTEFG